MTAHARSTDISDPTRPLAGVRIVEISSFVAVPLAGHDAGSARRRGGAGGPDRRRRRLPPLAGHRRRDEHLLGGAEQGQAVRGGRLPLAGRPGPRAAPDRRQRRAHHECGRARMAFVRQLDEAAARPDPCRGVRARRRRHGGGLHRQRRPRISDGDRPGRAGHPGQPRAPGMGRRVRHLRGAGRRHRVAAPRRHRAGPADQHSAGERRAGDGRQPQLPDRGDGERHRHANGSATRSTASTARNSPAATGCRS